MGRSLGLIPPLGPASESPGIEIRLGPSKACVTLQGEGPESKTACRPGSLVL